MNIKNSVRLPGLFMDLAQFLALVVEAGQVAEAGPAAEAGCSFKILD